MANHVNIRYLSLFIHGHIYTYDFILYIYIYFYVCISKLVRAFYGSTPPPLGWWVVVLQVLQQFGDVPGQTPELWKFRGRETKKNDDISRGPNKETGVQEVPRCLRKGQHVRISPFLLRECSSKM